VTRITGHAVYRRDTPYVRGPVGNGRIHRVEDAARGRAESGRSKKSFRCGAGSVFHGGDVVFYGTLDVWVQAADAKSGRSCGSSRSVPASGRAAISFRGTTGSSTSPCPRASDNWCPALGDVRSDDPADVRPSR